MHPYILFLVFAALFQPLHGALAQRADPGAVAIVTQISGTSSQDVGTTAVALKLLTELREQHVLRLSHDSNLVVLYYANAKQYALRGPAVIRIGRERPYSMQGAEPEALRSLQGRDGASIRIEPSGVTEGALILRGGGAIRERRNAGQEEVKDRRPEADATLAERVTYTPWLESLREVRRAQ